MSYLATFILKSPNHEFEGTGLHDATLLHVTLDWQAAEVRLSILLSGGIPATLAFHEATGMVLSRKQAWGRSSSINESKTISEGKYEIEMQSGDVLQFNAGSWSLSITASPGEA
jgi:hypothetical protein